MRQGLVMLAILAIYGLIAYSIGIPLPPQPWLSLIGLVGLETILLWSTAPLTERMVGPVTKNTYTAEQNGYYRLLEVRKLQRAYVLLVIGCSTFSMTAVLCCHDSAWTGPQGDGQGAILFCAILLNAIGLFILMLIIGSEISDAEKFLADPSSLPTHIETDIETEAQSDREPDLEVGLDSKR